MSKSYNPPEGYYSAEDAMRVLGMTKAMFYDYVKQDRILKYIPPGLKQGYYKKDYIDALALKIREGAVADHNDYEASIRNFPITHGNKNSE
jgi:hypothetical protein